MCGETHTLDVAMLPHFARGLLRLALHTKVEFELRKSRGFIDQKKKLPQRDNSP
jgi:hypothetical protein